ncbi:MAG: proline dehydrogenase family protein [Ignavibacteria bacterium]|nr:proline dehydrogenase family protein [Ignavibacteria bacterium]
MSYINNLIVTFVQLLPKSIVRVFSGKYIAGDTLQDAVSLTLELNKKGIYTTIDVLGEDISTRDEAIYAKNECSKILDAIKKFKLKSNLSIKPTQMGLMLDSDFCYQQLSELLDKAVAIDNFVRIDMEDSNTTDKTFALYKRLRQKYNNVGVVVQSYLKRTLPDVKSLLPFKTNFRLCKGIYIEPEEIAFKSKNEIRKNYLDSLRFMLQNDLYVGIATHDEYLVNESYKMIKELNVSVNKFEFQMLLGVREDLRTKINEDGYKVRVYVPFGKDWYAYSIRRLKENPQVAGHIVKNLFGLK